MEKKMETTIMEFRVIVIEGFGGLQGLEEPLATVTWIVCIFLKEEPYTYLH